jgi:multidrug efflux pump subunit AcrA (membrane-fusion protein)
VDASSGQMTLRAEVPNPDGLLLPGQYVRVRLSQAELPAGITAAPAGGTRSNQGDTVLVVGADGKPGPRTVKVGNAQNNQWVILDGLKAGDQVIVDGFQKMMVPGAPGEGRALDRPGAATRRCRICARRRSVGQAVKGARHGPVFYRSAPSLRG